MGCILAKLDWCVVARCCNCTHLRLGCILIGLFAIAVWVAVIFFFLFDVGIGISSVVHDNWLLRGYILAMLIEAAVRITISIVLIIGAAKKKVVLLAVFLVSWIVMVVWVVGALIFAIAISRVDGATVVFHLVYAAGRFSFTVLAIFIVNSYRIQLANERDEKKQMNPALKNTSDELVL